MLFVSNSARITCIDGKRNSECNAVLDGGKKDYEESITSQIRNCRDVTAERWAKECDTGCQIVSD